MAGHKGFWMKQLNAAEELEREKQAEGLFQEMLESGGFSEDGRIAGLWAVANNAALAALSCRKGNKRRFASCREVLRSLSLKQIAGMAQQYGGGDPGRDWEEE